MTTTMRRFETNRHPPYEFWEIELAGVNLSVYQGYVGTEGRTWSTSYRSELEAAESYRQHIVARTRLGFIEVDPTPSQAERRLEDEAWQVRADRLQAAGDPWGQRIALSMALEVAAHRTERGRLGHELRQLEAAHSERFYGAEYLRLQPRGGLRDVRLDWKRGCIVHAEIRSGNRGVPMADVVHAVVQSPAAEFLRSLTIRMSHPETEDARAIVSAVTAGRPLVALDSFDLSCGETSQATLSRTDIGDLSGLWPITPNLHTLELHGCSIGLDRLEYARLQKLSIGTTRLSAASVGNLATAKLPELRRMELSTHTLDDIVPLFESTMLPKLEHLDLKSAERLHGADVVLALAGSPLLEQLRHVWFKAGAITEAGAQALIDHAEHFQRLESLYVPFSFIPSELHEPLRTAIPALREW